MRVCAAKEAGLKSSDIIVKLDKHEINSISELMEIMEQHRPGEKIVITINRNGTEKQMGVMLKENDGIIPKSTVSNTKLLAQLGIKIEPLTESEKKQNNILGGVKVVEISDGKIIDYTNIKVGFIILKTNGMSINTKEDFIKAIENTKDVITLQGIYPNVLGSFYYLFGVN